MTIIYIEFLCSVVLTSPILVVLMMEAKSSSDTSVLATAIRSNIPGEGSPWRPQILRSMN
jgi:hypothetical protein